MRPATTCRLPPRPGRCRGAGRLALLLLAPWAVASSGAGQTVEVEPLEGPWYTGSAAATSGVPSLSARTASSFIWGAAPEGSGSSALRGLLWSNFEPRVLQAEGDSLTVRFDLTFEDFGATPVGANGIRFGLFASNGSRLAADIPDDNVHDAFLPYRGYLAMWATPADVPGLESQLLYRAAGRNNPLSVNQATAFFATELGAGADAAGVSYPVEFTVRLGAGGAAEVESRFNGEVLAATSPSAPSTAFDGFFMLNTPQAGGINALDIAGAELVFTTADPPAPAPLALVITEVHHAPAEATASEVGQGYSTADFQFVELLNTGVEAADLSGLQLTAGGVTTVFADGVTLPIGGRGVVAGDAGALLSRHPEVDPATVLATLAGPLGTSGTIRLEGATGRLLDEIDYGDLAAGWPPVVAPGHSLTQRLERDRPGDGNQPGLRWRPSIAPGGSPGAVDGTAFADWQAAHGIVAGDGGGRSDSDTDGDGDSDLVEYAAGSDPGERRSRPPLAVEVEPGAGGGTVTFTYERSLSADEAEVELLTSHDTRYWSAGESVTVGREVIAGGRERISARSATGFSGGAGSDGDRRHVFGRVVARLPGPRPAPNVLFIAVDDLRPQLGAYGTPGLVTPNMDRLAREGRVFNRHYVQCPTCGSSRYAMLTSLRPREPGAALNSAFTRLTAGVPGRPSSLPQAFRFAGYRTVAIGKVSHEPGGNFDDGQPEMPGAWDGASMPTGPWGSPERAFFGYAGGTTRQRGVSPRTEAGTAADGVTSLEDTDYPDGLIAEAAVAQLRAFAGGGGERFFLAVGFFKPHLPFACPKRYWDLYDRASLTVPVLAAPTGIRTDLTLSGNGEFFNNYGGPNSADEDEARLSIHAYNACVSYVDAQVGKVLDELDALGLANDTVVVLWGDHGWHLGEHTVWGKHTTLEESLRSPLIVRTPRMPFRGVATDAFAESIDIYPTLCQLCGIDVPGSVEGTSLLPLLQDPGASVQEHALSYWQRSGQSASSIRTGRYRMVAWDRGPGTFPFQVDLFDYEQDPAGAHSVTAENPDVVADLRARIDALR